MSERLEIFKFLMDEITSRFGMKGFVAVEQLDVLMVKAKKALTPNEFKEFLDYYARLRKEKQAREIKECFQIYRIRSVHTGFIVCVGFTKETPEGMPTGDVIHLCWLGKEAVEKDAKTCCVNARLSMTPGEARMLALALIEAQAFYKVEAKKESESGE